jgi:hypothetical protein
MNEVHFPNLLACFLRKSSLSLQDLELGVPTNYNPMMLAPVESSTHHSAVPMTQLPI